MSVRILVLAFLAANVHCARAAEGDADIVEIDATSYKTPTKAVPASLYPKFSDDYSLRGMKLAIERQLKRYAQKGLTGTITFGAKTYPLTKMKSTLVLFNELIDQFDRCKANNLESRCFADLNAEIKRKFDVYIPALVQGDPRYGEDNWALFTGYHTMPIEGSVAPTAEYPHPVYGNPKDPKLFYSRVEIDFLGALKNRGLELLYTKSLFDIYLLHVQGSGKATLLNPDGSRSGFYLNYDGTNKQKWEWISKYMAAKGYISNGSIPAQRKFLREHPELQQEIYANCPSYVFSKISYEPPMGNDSVPVTDARSIAQDYTLYSFKGTLSYVETERPVENGNYDLELEDPSKIQFVRFARFFLDQDTGGAIKGKARADVYFGEDRYSQFSAQNMKQTGRIYYIIAK